METERLATRIPENREMKPRPTVMVTMRQGGREGCMEGGREGGREGKMQEAQTERRMKSLVCMCCSMPLRPRSTAKDCSYPCFRLSRASKKARGGSNGGSEEGGSQEPKVVSKFFASGDVPQLSKCGAPPPPSPKTRCFHHRPT